MFEGRDRRADGFCPALQFGAFGTIEIELIDDVGYGNGALAKAPRFCVRPPPLIVDHGVSHRPRELAQIIDQVEPTTPDKAACGTAPQPLPFRQRLRLAPEKPRRVQSINPTVWQDDDPNPVYRVCLLLHCIAFLRVAARIN